MSPSPTPHYPPISDDDTTFDYILPACARIAKALKAQFEPFLALVMSPLLAGTAGGVLYVACCMLYVCWLRVYVACGVLYVICGVCFLLLLLI